MYNRIGKKKERATGDEILPSEEESIERELPLQISKNAQSALGVARLKNEKLRLSAISKKEENLNRRKE